MPEWGRCHDREDCAPPAAPGRARGLGAAVEGLSRFLPDHGAAGDLRRDLGAAARSERADVAARRLRRRQASRHRALHLSPLLLDDRRLLLQDLFVAEGARKLGLGRALIEAVYEAARAAGASRVHWLTHETNAVARSLYDTLADRPGFIQYRKLL